MRRVIAFFVILMMSILAFNLVSCSKEPEELLMGSWESVKATSSAEGYTFDNTDAVKGLVLEIKEGGELVCAFEGKESGGKWTYAADNLTLEIGGVVEAFHVDNLDKRSMTLTTTETENGITATMVIEFEKM